MFDKRKIKIQQKVIKRLSEENEEISNKLDEERINSQIREEDLNKEYEHLRNLIAECDKSKAIFENATNAAREAQEGYEKARQEYIYLQQEYKRKMDKLLKQLGYKNK